MQNSFVAFLRHYGPIAASDNMYDELIQAEIDRLKIDPVITIEPARLSRVLENFRSVEPRNVILTGTAGDGKTYHCRRVWEDFGGDPRHWQQGKKFVALDLPESGKNLTIIKDLSELTQKDKDLLLPGLMGSIAGSDKRSVFLVAANDGQLIASLREWAEYRDDDALRIFRIIEDILVEDRINDEALNLELFNLSRLDAAKHFEELIDQIITHPQWSQCEGCELFDGDGSTVCPIRINRSRLLGDDFQHLFRDRIGELLKLARANRTHLPIRDLLLLASNILLGDMKPGQPLLTCRTARNRASKLEYRFTNPYANTFGANLADRQRSQYQVFTTLEAFGVGKETDNRFDNLLIYGEHGGFEDYEDLVGSDQHYGAQAYSGHLRDYLDGEREELMDFMRALRRQRQRLFFTIPDGTTDLDPWHLTVYRSSGMYLKFVAHLVAENDVSQMVELLIRGLNRSFCGLMIDEGTILYLSSSGGDGRGRISSLLDHDLRISRDRRHPYVVFKAKNLRSNPRLVVIDPAGTDEVVDQLEIQLTHFEYLVRVANGSLPASFSRQCHQDFLDFKLRLIERLDRLLGAPPSSNEVDLTAISVDERGRVQPDNIRILVAS